MNPPTTGDAFDGWNEEPINELIARARAWRGKTQDALVIALCDASGNVSVDRSYISRWENGKRIPTPYWRRHLATVLGIPEDVLDRAVAIARARRERGADANPPLQSPQDTGTALTVTWAATPRSMGDAMNRAQFLSLMGATTAGAFAEEAFELLRFTETTGPSATTVSIMEETVTGMAETYSTVPKLVAPPEQFVGPLGQYLATTRRMLSGSPGAQRQRLQVVGSQAATLLGQVTFILNDRQHARLYLHTAEQLAYEAGHPALAGYAISMQSTHARIIGDPRTSLDLARKAQQVSSSSAPDPLRAWLATLEAHALALLGESQACERALEAAAAAAAHGHPDGASRGGLTFFTGDGGDRLVWIEASCRAEFDQPAAARDAFARVEAMCSPKQKVRRTLIGLEVAGTFVREDDVNQACATAIQALDSLPPEHRRDGVVTAEARTLDTRLTARWPSEPAVREFHEHLMTA